MLTMLMFCAPAIARADTFEPTEERAKAAFRQQTWEEAAELYRSLLETAGSRADVRRRQGWATRRGKALLKARRFDVAVTSLLEARQLARTTGFDEPDLDSLLGFAHLQLGDMPRAITALEAARRAWKLERYGDEPLDRVTLMRQHAHVDRLLQSAYLQSRNSATAYQVSEEARAQSLTAMLENRRPGLLDPGPWTFERAQQLARDLSTTIVAYTILGTEERVLGDEPADERMVVSYVISPEQSAAGGLRLDSTDPTPVSDLVLGLRPKILGDDEDAALVALAELYDVLIHPVAQFLPEEGGSLTIVPDGVLQLVPFAALLDRGDDGLEAGTFLVERYEIRYGLSAAQLEASRRRAAELAGRGAVAGGLIIGNPQSSDERLDLEPLPGAEREASAIAAMLGTEPWLGPKARKSAVLSAVKNASLLHFATHAILGLDPRLDDLGQSEEGAPSGRELGVNANPGGLLVGKGVRIGGVDAAVALAREKVVRVPLAGGIVLADGLLFSGELASLDLSARLAVLSACSTGRGRITEEGAIGLRWAHLAAGVPGVVSSLWSVPDAPTAELMIDFYRQLLDGESASSALRGAMLEIRREHPRVSAWAAFGVTGVGGLSVD